MRSENLVPSLSIDYRALIFRYRKNWFWFALTLLVFGSLAFLQLRYATPEYTTKGSFIVEDPLDSDGVSTRQFTQQLGFFDQNSIEDELNVMRSRALMCEVVKNLKLNIKVVHKGKVRDVDIYQPDQFVIQMVDSLNQDSVEPEYGSISILGNSKDEFRLVSQGDTTAMIPGESFLIGNKFFSFKLTDKYESPGEDGFWYVVSYRKDDDVAGSMVGKLSISQKGQSNTVDVVYTDTDPDRAADVVNELINVYNYKTINERSLTGEQTVAFIDSRLEYVSRELYSVEASVAGLRQNEGMVVDQATRGADYLAQLNEADAQLSELQVRRTLIDELRMELSGSTESHRPLSVASEIIDGTLTLLVDRYNTLIFERSQTLEVAMPNNPVVITFTERLKNLRRSLRQSVETLYEETNERISRIEQRIQPIEQSMNRMPENERKLLQVLRQQKIKENLFVFLMQKREEAALTVAAQIPNTRIVDKAIPKRVPISPKPKQTYMLAFGLAFLIPGLYMFLQEAFDTKLQSEKDLEKLTGLTVIGRIAQSSKKAAIVVSRDNRSGVAEMFRLLRTNLGFMFKKDRTPVLLFTSGVSGEGKTFVASNLGYSLALGNKRTVLVGADLRKPRLAEAMKNGARKTKRIKPGVGLSNYLIGQATYDEILKPTNNENLFLIESGPIPPNPSELLLRGEIGELIRRLREDFDVVIIDSTPVGLVTDALLLKELVDITLYVVRLGYTPKMSLDVLTDISDKDKLPNVGVVVNGLQPKRDYGYGYAQGYYK
ncbi:GumC family protein [Neolewinella agarilytica]|uniref:Capsular exopolysaccharide family n=2 Tax=Neolewinella agarilytica TaxID=478744 RepID=A0A1H9GMN8_9BACT|nr:polysaccharide biosynthesis tyrosine autokinase [Neolewinella agarilytica]SEQ51218.1 capsular exopolysaccharide family [Neolewinella agarilytica]